MFRMFIGMIIGAMAAIMLADGPATADRIMENALAVLNESDSSSSFNISPLMLGASVALYLFWRFRKKRTES